MYHPESLVPIEGHPLDQAALAVDQGMAPEALLEHLVSHAVEVYHLEAAYGYSRKGYQATDSLDCDERNSYGRDDDPIILQVTALVQPSHPLWAVLKEQGERKRDARQEAALAQAAAELAQARANFDRLLQK